LNTSHKYPHVLSRLSFVCKSSLERDYQKYQLWIDIFLFYFLFWQINFELIYNQINIRTVFVQLWYVLPGTTRHNQRNKPPKTLAQTVLESSAGGDQHLLMLK
jgi:hypothetical protein